MKPENFDDIKSLMQLYNQLQEDINDLYTVLKQLQSDDQANPFIRVYGNGKDFRFDENDDEQLTRDLLNKGIAKREKQLSVIEEKLEKL